jgi:hypothetical protein
VGWNRWIDDEGVGPRRWDQSVGEFQSIVLHRVHTKYTGHTVNKPVFSTAPVPPPHYGGSLLGDKRGFGSSTLRNRNRKGTPARREPREREPARLLRRRPTSVNEFWEPMLTHSTFGGEPKAPLAPLANSPTELHKFWSNSPEFCPECFYRFEKSRFSRIPIHKTSSLTGKENCFTSLCSNDVRLIFSVCMRCCRGRRGGQI